MTATPESAFELCERISPVALIYGRGSRLFVSEHNSSRRLLKELWRLGRKRTPVRGMICQLGALDRESVRALNCFLEHRFGRNSLNSLRAGKLHRWCWYEMQRDCSLRWRR